MNMDFLNDERLNRLNHSAAHVLAQAVKHLYPQAKFWVGPVVEEGFYYDIDLGEDVIRDEDIPKIEKEMKKIIKDGKRIVREEISKAEAIEMFKDDEYKLDLINDLEDGTITVYRQGGFVDLCRGPHVDTVKEVKNFKLMKHSGAYWKGDKNNKVLQRIYGVCFETKEDLEAYLNLLEEAKRRDHKKLGRELDIFMMSEYAPGMPFFLPNGMIIRNLLEEFWYEVHKDDYSFIKTPIMMSKELWELSGHWANYQDNMYTCDVDDRVYAIKPMNCPGGMLVYKNGLHSYKDLPIRSGELGQVHRHEASGALNGLFRVRTFTQDDAHIFMREDQIESEILRLLKLIDKIYSTFKLDYRIELSTRPEDKYIGTIESWDKSEAILQKAIEASGKEWKLNPGDGAFYGPKLDFHIRDSLGRSWQCGTIQLDANLPERFDLTYVDADGTKKRPVMLHRAIFGSIERFIGILIEHYAGAFPTWLAPVQVAVLPVKNEYHLDYANEVVELLKAQGIRVDLDAREEKLGYRIRENQMKKSPFMLILGDTERDEKTISFRRYGEQKTTTVSQEEFVALVTKEIETKE
ncbi:MULTISPECIES: threonine--tRNA ligase [unclassified Breznakia]|uniref:threonine--tRNA ligase n=1 Tax=unclassified Breznakia TaxID=2623764 RepID=UPI00247516E2|nr:MULTISPECIES: threonine--tRNA ligase [unclassified Breznakia]MDH6367902.1 threonyl-tRNA synthetase [Breznakia sp. PH1-1]MDH6404990.1 threonyl-tRNA synthetase [Breznakia sp. PF1-11]MDH6412699.1 threonyl-tRNA synthetase [Breznakia sp. PFB1-11]MDH6415065.1 threonyl-tRNA synthetase [Breznakia sp. PFB1-14]MDH6417376.1 threonyl-tRNA synthetase [Breznakia sp. PFB1-4]